MKYLSERKLFTLHVPLLQLERRNDEPHIGMQFNPFASQKEMPLCLAEEIELEEVSAIPLVRVEPTPLLRAFRRVQQKVHAARAFGVFQQGNMLRRVVVYAVSVFAIHLRCFI